MIVTIEFRRPTSAGLATYTGVVVKQEDNWLYLAPVNTDSPNGLIIANTDSVALIEVHEDIDDEFTMLT